MADKRITIEVGKIYQKGQFYSVMSTDEEWYGFGQRKPKFDEGDVISFEVTKNGKYLNADPSSVEIESEGAAQSKKTSEIRRPKQQGNAREDYWTKKEEDDVFRNREIRYAGSRNAALEFVKLALQYDAIPLGKTKAQDKEEVLLQYLDNYTEMFYKATTAARDITDVETLSNPGNKKNKNEDFVDDELDGLE